MVGGRCKVMDAIGGYFSLELPLHEEYHKDAIKLNTGRNCLEYILRCRQYKKVYIPYYTCEVILEPFQKLSVAYEFYHINLSFEISDEIHLQEGEALLYTNYYGLKQRYVKVLVEKYGRQLIIDNTQAFYAKPVPGIDTFYTCRKFFGVPDGAYLYTDKLLDMDLEQDVSYERMSSLTKRIDISPEAGYQDFRDVSESLVGQPIKCMSKLTQRMMRGVDYESIVQRRRVNYQMLEAALGHDNNVVLTLENDAVPMVYPYMTNKEGLRNHLIQNRVFVAKYWPNVDEWVSDNSIEYKLTNNMLPLPIDQRYGIIEMGSVVELIKQQK